MKKFLLLSILLFSQLLMTAQIIEVKVNSLRSQQPVDSVEVFLRNEKNQQDLSVFSDQNGIARFDNLTYGDTYTIFSLDNDDFQFASLPSLKLKEGGKEQFQLYLPERVTALLGEVLISSSPMAKINTQNATVSGQIKKEEIQKMPIEGRDITRSLYRLPNVTLAVLGYNEGPNISINGLNGIFTNYLVDGMDNNERFLGNMKINTPVGFVENVTVLTNNYSAEWGNTSNGIVNVLSRSGTNDVSGEVFYLTRPGSVIDSPSEFATRDLYGNLVKDGFQRNQFGFSVGGALKKDKTFFYINAEQTIDVKDNLLNSPDLGVNETIRGNNYFTYVNAKVDHNWSQKFRSSLRGQVGRIYNGHQGGGLEGGTLFPSGGSAQDNDTYIVALRNQISLNSNLATELNVLSSYFRWNYNQPFNTEIPQVSVRNPSNLEIAALGPGSIFDDEEYTNQIQHKWFYTLNNHHFKAGAEFITSDFQLTGGGNPNGSYTVRLNDDQLATLRNSGLGASLMPSDLPSDVLVSNYNVELTTAPFGVRQNVYSIYAEDNWDLSDMLTINIGIRYDYDNLSKSGSDTGDYDNVAPRLSANFKLNERSVIRGGYGIAYDKIKYSVYSDALQFSKTTEDYKKQLRALQDRGLLDSNADIDQITFQGNIQATAPGVAYLQGPTSAELSDGAENVFSSNARILNPNGWENPYSHQFSLGYQYKPNNETIFIFDAVHTRTEGLYIIKNLNVASPYLFEEGIDPENVVPRSPIDGDASRPIPILQDEQGFYALANGEKLYGGSRNVFMTETAGRATYSALNFMLQKEINQDKIGYRLLYTLSWTKSNVSSINTRAQDNNDFETEFVWDENDRRHVMSAVLLYQPLRGLTVAPTALIQSGQPVTRVADATIFGTGDLNGDRESFGLPSDRWPGEDENADRLPWNTTFDVSIKYYLKIGETGTGIEFSADVFNLFDAQNFSGYNTTRSVSNQIQVGPPDSYNYRLNSASPPRQFQFGARYIF